MRHDGDQHSDDERRDRDEHRAGLTGAGGSSRQGPDPTRAVDRRSFLARTAVAGAAAWATPVALSSPAAAGPGTGLAVGDFVAVGFGGNIFPVASVTSDGGTTWSTTTQQFQTGELRAVAAAGSTAVAVGTNQSSLPWQGSTVTSFDGGSTWSAPVSVLSNGDLTGVATNGSGRWVAVGTQGTRGASVTSDDAGATWSTPVQLPVNQHLQSVANGGTTWIAGGQNMATTTGFVVRSTDGGASWEAPIALGPGRVYGVATDGAGNWMAVTASTIDPPPTLGPSQVWLSSNDGVTWSGPLLTVAGDLFGVATAGGTWLVVGQLRDAQEQTTVWRSTNLGATWSSPITVTATRSAAWAVAPGAAGTWVVVGYRYVNPINRVGASWTSSDDGLTWPTGADADDSRLLEAVAAT